MIVGVGTDLVEVARIARAVERFGERFLERVFLPGEIAFCRRRINSMQQCLAARFAAKEAAAKALGTGMSRGLHWREIEIGRLRGQRPTVLFHGAASERARHLQVTRIHLSVSHTPLHAMATVIVEAPGAPEAFAADPEVRASNRS